MRMARSACLCGLFLVLALSGCGADGSPRSAAVSASSAATRHDPLLNARFYVDPASPAAEQLALEHSQGETQAAAAMARVASQPTGNWFTDAVSVQQRVSALVAKAAAAGTQPLLVAYYIPGRDCGGYSSGGAPSPDAYRTWITEFAAGIGSHRATVILEPDAIPQALSGCLNATETRERLALLRFAVGALRRQGVSVYLDAGNPGWIRSPAALAAPLREAGVAQAAGFALNVSNFFATAPTIAYGEKLSRALGPQPVHFVIDTSRNGNGAYGSGGKGLDWCNPPGRALGPAPGSNTANPLVDAYLWVKQPGTSDGSCHPGDPRPGRWWPQYALALAGDPQPGL
jgi:endoglucanase